MDAQGSGSDSESQGMDEEVLQELKSLTMAPRTKRPKRTPTAEGNDSTAKELYVMQQIQAEQYDMIAHLDEREVERVAKYIDNHSSPVVELAGDFCDTSAKKYLKTETENKLLLARMAQMDQAVYRLRQEVPMPHILLKKIDTNAAAQVDPDYVVKLMQDSADELGSLRDYRSKRLGEEENILTKNLNGAAEVVRHQEKELKEMEGGLQTNTQSVEDLTKACKDLRNSWKKLLRTIFQERILDETETRCEILEALWKCQPGALPAEVTHLVKQDPEFLDVLEEETAAQVEDNSDVCFS